MIPRNPQIALAQQKAFVDSIIRDNSYHKLAKQAGQAQRSWYSRGINRLLCEINFLRVVLAGRLERNKSAVHPSRGRDPSSLRRAVHIRTLPCSRSRASG